MKAQVNFDSLGGGGNGKCDEILASSLSTSSFATIPLGFVPSVIVMYMVVNNGEALILKYDVANSKIYSTMRTDYNSDSTSIFLNSYMYVDGTDFKYKARGSGYVTNTTYIAIE